MRRYSLNRYLVLGVGAVLLYSVLLYSGTIYLQEQMAEGLVQSTGAAIAVVELRPKLPLGLLSGSFSEVKIELGQALLGPIVAEQVVLAGREVDIALLRLIRGGPLTFDRLDQVEARLDLSEENLNAYFERFSIAGRFFQVTCNTDTFQLSGVIPILGRRLEVSLQGTLAVLPENRLRVIPLRLVMQNAEMPPVLLEELLQDYLIIPLDLTSLPVPLELSEVLLAEGGVSVIAHTR